VWSKSQVNEYLSHSGLVLDKFSFGIRDLFTQVAIMAHKPVMPTYVELAPNQQRRGAPHTNVEVS
jgi:hypothetical protein